MKNNKKITKIISYASVLVLAFLVTSAFKSKTDEETIPTIANVDTVVKDEMIKQELVGVAIGIVQNGRIIHVKGYGYSDRDKKIKMTTRTPIRWASISKVLTAVATFQLVEKGNLNVNDKVSSYLDANVWPRTDNKKNITLQQLLSHRSGITHYGGGRDLDGDKKPDRRFPVKSGNYTSTSTTWNSKQSVSVFKDTKLDFVPGKGFLYSTYGYNLLGAVIDKVSPNGYQGWVNKYIKAPLNMRSLAPSINKSEGYTKNCKGEVSKELSNGKMPVLPGGGWISNIEDATKFMQALINGKLLNNMPLLKCYSKNGRYCSGLQKLNRCGEVVVGHGGSHDNLRTHMFYYPNSKDGIVIMSNGSHTYRDRFFQRLSKVIGKSCSPNTEASNADCMKKSCSNKIAATWRASGKDAIIRRGYDYDSFFNQWKTLTNEGYQCTDIETYQDGRIRKWDGIFIKKSGKSAMWRGFSQDNFKKKWQEMSSKGFRLIDLETYGSGKNRKWSGIFVAGKGKYAMFRNYSTDAFGKKREELAKKGYKLIDIEAYEDAGKLKWAGVWREGKDGKLNRNMTQADFGKKHDTWAKQGYRLIDREAYRVKGKLLWAGVWGKAIDAQKINSNLNYCQILKKNEQWEKSGLEMVDIEIY